MQAIAGYPSAPAPRALPRESLLALGRAGKPWEFLPLAVEALAEAPDPALTLLAASNFARLGLRTAAIELIQSLPEAVRSAPDINTLSGVIGAMPDDRIAAQELIAAARKNLEALGDRVFGLEAGDWETWLASREFFRAGDGNIVRRQSGVWAALADERSLARRALHEHKESWKREPAVSLVVEGVSPPWLVLDIMETCRRQALGFLAPVSLIQADPHEFLAGLALADLSEHFASGRAHAFVGPDASHHFRRFLEGRMDRRMAGTFIRSPGTAQCPARCANPPVESVLRETLSLQDQQTRQLAIDLASRHATHDAHWWGARFADTTRPLRALIITCRYSTYIKHASRDLAEALEGMGHKARVLIEPDDHSYLDAHAYLSEIKAFEPDLIVVINFPRYSLGEIIPRNIPYVCWIQDALPHLFDRRLGENQRELDFVVGHLPDELFDRYAYKPERSLQLNVPASESKFHPTAIHANDRARFACEVAYVSHQSETPEALHRRVLGELPADPRMHRALDDIRAVLDTEVTELPTDFKYLDVHEVTRPALRKHLGQEPESQAVDRIARCYAGPYADRLLRHQTLQWASNVCNRRGWKLQIFGRGWEKHPTLAPHARSELAHGDDLRACYQAAGCHLQVTFHSLVHQRLAECVLSGGVPLCRMHRPERDQIAMWLAFLAIDQGAHGECDRTHPHFWRTSWTGAPAMMRMASIFQQMDAFEDCFSADSQETLRHGADSPVPNPRLGMRWGPLVHMGYFRDIESHTRPVPEKSCAFYILGQQPELFFHTEQTLEARLSSLIEQPDARERLIARARTGISRHFTFAGAARSIVDFVRSRLTEAQPVRSAA
ncbi:MAG: hypothetical protein U0573_01640 [Phycisphaerales bacterium]|nr:hypothetical protein [Planctomycetota bacterium]